MTEGLKNIYLRDRNCPSCEIYESVLDLIPEPLVIVDREGYIVFFNQAYENYLGISKEKALGRYVTEVIDNTRLHIVCKSGKSELDCIQKIKNRDAIVQRIPIVSSDGENLGAIGKVNFQNKAELKSLMDRLRSLENELTQYKEHSLVQMRAAYTFDEIAGASSQMEHLKDIAAKYATTDLSILILGETGVGKDIFAQAIHNASLRQRGPLVSINCAAIPHDLLESELFGYEDGAFTGARKKGKPGKFELADGGTLFLDEIGDMPLSMQAKLLRVLQNKQIERIGGTSSRGVDVRIIASTNQDLSLKIRRKEFREDLLYRLNAATIKIPPLRERPEDIKTIIEKTLEKLEIKKVVEEQAMKCLEEYHWPGNVRELINVVERLVYLTETYRIGPREVKLFLFDLFEGQPQDGPQALTPGIVEAGINAIDHEKSDSEAKSWSKQDLLNGKLDDVMVEVEKQAIIQALERSGGNKAQAAKKLGIHRTTLYQKLYKHGLE